MLLAYPVGTAPVGRSSSQMKLIKVHLRIRISDINLAKLMRSEVEEPDLESVDTFSKYKTFLKEKKSAIISLCIQKAIKCDIFLKSLRGWGGWGGGRNPQGGTTCV